jgi:hypothetical protein
MVEADHLSRAFVAWRRLSAAALVGITFAGALVFAWACPGAGAAPADLTTGELRIGTQDALLTLVLPTGWVAFADVDGSGALSDEEIRTHATELATRLALRVSLLADGVPGALAVRPPSLPPRRLDLATDGRHATLALHYTWPQPVGALVVHYALFTPGVAGAMAQLAVTRDGTETLLSFTPEQPDRVFDGRAGGHRFAMSLNLLGRARVLETVGGLLLLVGMAYGIWTIFQGLKPPAGREQKR